MHNSVKNLRFFVRCDLEIWWMTLKNNRAPLLCYVKLCASFHSHRLFQAVVRVRKCQIRVKIHNFLSRVTYKFDRWPWKTIGHLCYATSSFVHQFIAIGHFKLELQSENAKLESNLQFFVPCDLQIWQMTLKNNRALLLCYFKLCASFHGHWSIQTVVTVRKCQIRVKISHFLPRVTLKFHSWPWTRQIWGIWKLRPAYSPETPNLGQNRWCFVPCDLEIWWMTLENNRASLLCCFKLCATFHSHWWIQTGITVRKRPIWVKFDDF